jgi:NodT family efflux transporter outer membrane factor (OMF) lipoprotein
MTIPAHYAGNDQWIDATPADTANRGAWWRIFNDPTLDTLEQQVSVSNQTIANAVAQLAASRESVRYQKAGWWPTLTTNTTLQRYRTSQNLVSRSLAGKTIPDYASGFSASWEPDVFGRIRANVDVANHRSEASTSDLEAVRLSVHAQLAIDYFSLRSLDRQQHILNASVDAYGKSRDILQQQYMNGAVDRSAVDLSSAQWASAKTMARDVASARAQMTHAIATLVGESASSFVLPDIDERVTLSDIPTLPEVPVGIPSQLLQRRPDIAAAERRVAAANADIGVARTAYFPQLMLSATAGLESSYFAPWLTAPSLLWSVGPQLVGTLFDGGRRKAGVAGARDQYDASVATYRQTVLQAMQQVEDAMSQFGALSDEAHDASDAALTWQRAATTMRHRFDAGAIDYIEMVNTQVGALNAQLTQEQIRQRRIIADVQLIVALGGSWHDAVAATPPASVSSTRNVTPDGKAIAFSEMSQQAHGRQ